MIIVKKNKEGKEFIGYGCTECEYSGTGEHLDIPCGECGIAHPTRAFHFFKLREDVPKKGTLSK